MVSKKITALFVTFIFMLSAIALPVAAQADGEITVIGKLAVIEKAVYGAAQTGALTDRIAKVEAEVYGSQTQEALLPRVDKLYAHVLETTGEAPSVLTKLNAVEWMLTHQVSDSAVKARVENLETIINGSPVTGAVDARLGKLLQLAYGSGQVQIAAVTIPKDTLVKVKTLSTLNSKQSKAGDMVALGVAEDVIIDGVLVFAKGASGSGQVKKVEGAKNFGRDAKMEIGFDTLQAVDGSKLATAQGDKAKKETQSLAKAAGATVAGMVILGPVGIIGGAFVSGKDVNIPIGSQLYVQTQEDVEIYGVKVQ